MSSEHGWPGFEAVTVVADNSPPECIAPSPSSSTCDAADAAHFHARAPPAGQGPAVDTAALRVWAFDGHTGPLNDMASFLIGTLGVDASRIDGMIFMQAMSLRSMLDPRILSRSPPLLGNRSEYQRLSRFLASVGTGGLTLPACEKRRCRDAVHDEATRHEFAEQFGALFADRVDAVVCNFPTWPCLLFAEHNLSVVLRFTHRRPNVVVAASNAYDDVYLRRTTGIAPVPWPGTSPQLAATPYTGTRSEVLFCCGNHAYNKAIRHWAALIANGSAARAAGTGSAPVRFAWLSELYTKSDQCRRAPTNATASRVYARSKVCGYSYEDVASHPLAVLLPYSMHSYGLVQAYSLGIPLLAPSLRLLSALHVATGLCSHKGPGNTPWRPSSGERRRVPFLNRWSIKDARAWFAAPPPSADVPCCASEPNDACTPAAAAQWLQFAEWYQWPHVTYFDSPQELHAKVEQLLRDESARRTISDGAKAFFAAERERTAGHVRAALQRSLRVAPARAAPREREGVPVEAEAPRHLQQPPAGRDVRPRRNEEGAAAGAAGVPDYLVGPFAFNNACVSFYADRASQLRPSVTSEAGDSAMLHGFSEYTLGYQRVLKVRPAEATDQLRRCERRSLGVLVPFSCNNVYHMAFHAVPSFEHFLTLRPAAAPPTFVPLVYPTAAVGRKLSADPRRWHAWEWALRAMTPRAEVAADVRALLNAPCTCFATLTGTTAPFHPAAPASRPRVGAFRAAALRSIGRLLGAPPPAPERPPLLWVRRSPLYLNVGESTPRRGLTNEGALLDALRRAGLGDALRPTTLEALPVAAQAREVAAAAGLVAVHGQALAWVLFLPWAERRTAAVELRPRGAKANIYEALSAALGVRYERVAATLADSCPSARWLQCNVTASPQKVTAALVRAAAHVSSAR